MAKVTAFIPQVWSARFTNKLRNSLVWGSLVNRNYEGEIRSAGNTVKIPTGTSSVTVGDYTRDTDITAEDKAAGSTTDLVVNKAKYFRFYVDDMDRVQSRPALMDEVMAEAAYKMAAQIDADIQTVVDGSYDATRNTDIGAKVVGAADFAEPFIAGLAEVKSKMTKANIPADGRWLVVTADVIKSLDLYFAANPAREGARPVTEGGVIRTGFVGRLMDFDLMVAPSVPQGTDADSDGTTVDHHRLFAGQGTNAVTHAMQITSTERYRPEDRFGDAVKGLNVYGTKVVHADRMFYMDAAAK